MTAKRKAPSDRKADKAWDKIMKYARRHALIVQAYGGAATLATPAAQREAGIRRKVLEMENMEEAGAAESIDAAPEMTNNKQTGA